MRDVIQVEDQYYIHSKSSMADDRTLVLKHAATFAVFDRHGDIQPVGLGEQGIYHDGTRFLSGWLLKVDGERPLLLSSTVRTNNLLLTADLTNPEIYQDGRLIVPQDTIHIFRQKFLWNGVCYERIHLTNYGVDTVDFVIRLEFDADYADIFEVRGTQREARGLILPAAVGPDRVQLMYEGLDGARRVTHLSFSPIPEDASQSSVQFVVRLPRLQDEIIDLAIICEYGEPGPRPGFDQALTAARKGLPAADEDTRVTIYTSNEQFNDWLNQSMTDLRMLITETPYGPYPYAGVPWFSTVFGRDGIITAFEVLAFDPSLAAGTLRYLAAHQAQTIDDEREAEPGKILHETRRGEMAALGEIPFGMYYGSVDVTPLFVVLAGAYYERTGDQTLINDIWPNIELALQWIDKYGDVDGDGFVEYVQHNTKGLIHQGWKDSHDSVFHADGSEAVGPIALCEVQAYVYGAKYAAARLAQARGDEQRANTLTAEAETLKARFNEVFWSDELSTYVLALDGQKRPCQVRSSNPGHCLFTGIATTERAALVANMLLAAASFSDWGIRTIATTEARYNPMSYHNGSVWPHDNALIADGLARYGFKEHVLKVLTGLFDASIFVDLHRLPELFCGLPRRAREGPTRYPVACAPQAWAAGAVFMLLRACLNMEIDAVRKELRFNRPVLPTYLQEVHIHNLCVGSALVDLSLHHHAEDVGIQVLRRSHPVDVVVIK